MSDSQTINDFSEQWVEYRTQEGFYASADLLADCLGELATLQDFKNKVVCDIGAGNGRFTRLLAGVAREVVAIEPSEAMYNCQNYCAGLNNIKYLKQDIYQVEHSQTLDATLDAAFSYGVLHHLPDPKKAVEIISAMLKPGGFAIIWVYGYEGNQLYLACINALRRMTVRLPHKALVMLSAALAVPLAVYAWASRYLRLPLRKYMLEVIAKLDFKARCSVIYDQLNPHIANYWTKQEFGDILATGGFREVRLYHRHGYSWTAMCVK